VPAVSAAHVQYVGCRDALTVVEDVPLEQRCVETSKLVKRTDVVLVLPEEIVKNLTHVGMGKAGIGDDDRVGITRRRQLPELTALNLNIVRRTAEFYPVESGVCPVELTVLDGRSAGVVVTGRHQF